MGTLGRGLVNLCIYPAKGQGIARPFLNARDLGRRSDLKIAIDSEALAFTPLEAALKVCPSEPIIHRAFCELSHV